MDVRIEVAKVIIFGIAWAFVLCLLALITNGLRILGGQPPYVFYWKYFVISWLVLWAGHSFTALTGP